VICVCALEVTEGTFIRKPLKRIRSLNYYFRGANNVLVKRGKELHEPDRMYLNPSQMVFVEPVGVSSKVAQLIAQAPH
jgi:hypothetical protein